MMLFNAVNLVMEKDFPVDSSSLTQMSLSIFVLFLALSFLVVITCAFHPGFVNSEWVDVLIFVLLFQF